MKNYKFTFEEEVKITDGLVKVVSTTYAIPPQIKCPRCGSTVELHNSGVYHCLYSKCDYSITAREYIKQELAKAENE